MEICIIINIIWKILYGANQNHAKSHEWHFIVSQVIISSKMELYWIWHIQSKYIHTTAPPESTRGRRCNRKVNCEPNSDFWVLLRYCGFTITAGLTSSILICDYVSISLWGWILLVAGVGDEEAIYSRLLLLLEICWDYRSGNSITGEIYLPCRWRYIFLLRIVAVASVEYSFVNFRKLVIRTV
jgi:hypothetical protein